MTANPNTAFLNGMPRKAASVALIVALAAGAALPASSANAGHRGYGHSGHHDYVVVKRKIVRHHDYRRHRHSGHNGDALAAGVIGFAIGAIVANQATRYSPPPVVYRQPQPVYVQPQPYYRPYPQYQRSAAEPRVIQYDDAASYTYAPWTPEWRDWCDNKYRSFNQSTGTYRGYDGKDHFCVVD